VTVGKTFGQSVEIAALRSQWQLSCVIGRSGTPDVRSFGTQLLWLRGVTATWRSH